MVLIAVLWGDIITPVVTNNFRHYTVLVLHMVLIAVLWGDIITPLVTNNFKHYTVLTGPAHGTDSCTVGGYHHTSGNQ
jgi:hypothetical protein